MPSPSTVQRSKKADRAGRVSKEQVASDSHVPITSGPKTYSRTRQAVYI